MKETGNQHFVLLFFCCFFYPPKCHFFFFHPPLHQKRRETARRCNSSPATCIFSHHWQIVTSPERILITAWGPDVRSGRATFSFVVHFPGFTGSHDGYTGIQARAASTDSSQKHKTTSIINFQSGGSSYGLQGFEVIIYQMLIWVNLTPVWLNTLNMSFKTQCFPRGWWEQTTTIHLDKTSMFLCFARVLQSV